MSRARCLRASYNAVRSLQPATNQRFSTTRFTAVRPFRPATNRCFSTVSCGSWNDDNDTGVVISTSLPTDHSAWLHNEHIADVTIGSLYSKPDTVLKTYQNIAGSRPHVKPTGSSLQHHMIQELSLMAWNLTHDSYVHARGEQAMAFLAPKGTGKTTLLQIWTRTWPSMAAKGNAKAVGVYLRMDRRRNKRASIPTVLATSLREAGCAHLVPDGICAEEVEMWQIVKRLDADNTYMMLVVDEFEGLLASDVHKSVLEDSWEALTYLGEEVRRRVVTVLCGSSASLPKLITANSSLRLLADRFPGIKHVGSLNSTKYELRRVRAPRPNDESAVKNMLSVETGGDQLNARLVAFMAGANARRVKRLYQRYRPALTTGDPADAPQEDPVPETKVQAVQENNSASDHEAELQAVAHLLIKANKKFLNKALSCSAEELVDLICDTDPESFQPISWAAAVDAIAACGHSSDDSVDVLQDLCDRAWLVNGNDVEVWPDCMASVLKVAKLEHLAGCATTKLPGADLLQAWNDWVAGSAMGRALITAVAEKVVVQAW